MSAISNLSVQIIIFLTLAQMFKIFNAIDTAKDAATNETEFTFLVTGGYRPPRHTLTKYLVSIRSRSHKKYFGDNHFCGGAIIGPRTILTAAHCLTGEDGTVILSKFVSVVAKTTNRLVRTDDTLIIDVKKIRVHPNYSVRITSNDIAVAELENDIDMDGHLAAIVPLASGPATPGLHCTVVGWGRLIDDGPLAADAIYGDIDIISNERCTDYETFTSGQICAANLEDSKVDSCSGDSGGPLICDLKLVGLVSYGFGCAAGFPGVYTDVWYYRNWLTESDSRCHAPLCNLVIFCAIVVINF